MRYILSLWKKSRERFGFLVYSYFKDTKFTAAIKTDGKF